MEHIIIGNIMSKPVITVNPKDSVLKVACTMVNNVISAVPVMKEGLLLGIITEADLVKKVVCKGKDSHQMYAADIMTHGVVTGRMEMTDHEAAELFTQYKIKKLPIMKNDKLIGIITQTDLVRMLAYKK